MPGKAAKIKVSEKQLVVLQEPTPFNMDESRFFRECAGVWVKITHSGRA